MYSRKFLTYLFFSWCAISLGACGIFKDYEVEPLSLPDEYQLPDSISINLDTLVIAHQLFIKDSILISLIDDAFENNFNLLHTEKDIEISEAYYKQAKGAFYPRLNFNLLSIEKRWFSDASRNSPSSSYYQHKGAEPPYSLYVQRQEFMTNMALSWEIDIWGKLRKQKEEAAYLYAQSKVVRRAIQTELVASIAEDYYTLLMLDEQLNVAEKNYKFRDSTLTMINLLYNAGEVSALAVQQAQSQVLDASSLISQLKQERSVRENNLRLLTGNLPSELNRSFSLRMEDSVYEEVRNLPLYLIQNRPDVLIAQYDLASANAHLGVTQRQRLPNLSISMAGGVESLLPQNWFNIPGSLFGEIAGGLVTPVLQGRKLKTAEEVAFLKREQAEINFQRKVYSAIVDVENSLAGLKGLEEQLTIANVKQLVSQDALESSRMLFQSGYANYLEVITTQSEALQTELNLVRTKALLLMERIQLYRALGGGWK